MIPSSRALWIALVGLVTLAGCTSTTVPAGQCVFDSDCENGNLCVARFCRPACARDADCLNGGTCARSASGARACVSPGSPRTCQFTSDCPPSTYCTRDGVCQAQCRTDYDCQVINPHSVCASGTCEVRCPTDYSDCDGDARNGCETNTRASNQNCGRCGRVCASSAGASTTCSSGECTQICILGYGDCDGNPGNGCESDLSQPSHCGSCTQMCTGDNGLCLARTDEGSGTRSYACAATCPAGTVRCGGTCVDLQSDALNCGACGTVCLAGPGSTATCTAGRCGVRCTEPSRQADCDGMNQNGCEVELTTSAGNCGTCGNTCRGGPRATPTCAMGRCDVACETGYANCDGDTANGCETDVRVTGSSCGMCGNTCPSRPNATATCADGACGIACATGFGDCDMNPANGCEADLSTTAATCGACGTPCASRPNATATCAGGACRYACNTGFSDCDGMAANGCEVNLQTDPNNCGACATACSRTGGTPSCTAGVCGIACGAGTANCDGDLSNGCETDTATNALNCGMCRNVCSFPSAGARCAGGVCMRTTCAAGTGDCDGMTGNGCEANLTTDANNCGACGNRCVLANATARCTASRCAVGACNTGFADCDGNPANGCEVNLQNDPLHCGMCPNACSTVNGTASCTAGACRIACAAGFGDCDGMVANGCETPTTTTVAHCGACGRACALPNATATCAASACAIASCAAGFGNCDGNAANGCETNLNTTLTACGACGRACSLANATAACSAGACVIAMCNAGFGNCDGMVANGCETNLTNTLTACGACGRTCSLPSATAACTAGACTVASCSAGRGDCDMMAANGCETDLTTNNSHCGTCGRACGAGTVCSAGVCSSVCASPTVYCAGACVNFGSDPRHCGMCGNACPSPANAAATCGMGVCGFTCNAGFGNCDGNPANGCETNLTSTATACGSCTAACSRANATAVCTSSACAIGTCNANFGNCDGIDSNGCETDLLSSVAHCGACGRACNGTNGTPSCVNRAGALCLIACNTGFGNCDSDTANGCETDLTTSNANCGACGRACGSGTHCAASLCVPDNDTCATATPIDLTRGTAIDLPFTVVNGDHTTAVDTLCASSTGPDVYFAITLTQNELVYADTFGTTFDTVLFFAQTTIRGGPCRFYALSPRPGEVWCSDDATRTTGDYGANCPTGGTQSQVVGRLSPGTYYLGVAGYGTATGSGTIHFQHLPITGTGDVQYIPQALTGARVGFGRVFAASGTVTTTCGGGAGPEDSFWWRSCPDASTIRMRAETCTGTSVGVDTILDLRHASGAAGICSDDYTPTRCTVNTRASYIDTVNPTGAGIHTLTLDTYFTPAAGLMYGLVINETIIGTRAPFTPAPRGPSVCPARYASLPTAARF